MKENSSAKRKFKSKNRQTNPRLDMDPSSFLLGSLIKAKPHHVSGSALGEKLKMSRVGIWARINKLRKDGLAIEATQNLGYRLVGEPKIYNRFLIEAWLHECGLSCPVHLFDSLESTNSQAEKILAEGASAPFVVLANKQTSGRGRRERIWHSPKEGNIYLSIAFRPDVELVKLRNFTLWQGICIARFLESFTGVEGICLKWPNDLMHQEKKFGGMLTEASIDCDRVRSLVFGLGINVNVSTSRLPPEIQARSCSLSSITSSKWPLHELTAKLIAICLNSSNECFKKNTDERLIEAWQGLDFLKGKKISVDSGKVSYQGIANGIDISGGMRLKLKNGKEVIVHAGEISIF